MYGFFIKKNFCDGWDNILPLVISNISTMFVAMFFAWIISMTVGNELLFLLAVVLSMVAIFIFIVSFCGSARAIANFESVSIKDFFLAIPSFWKDGILFGLIVGISVDVFVVGIPFYFSQDSMFAFFVGAFMMWIAVFEIVSLQWFVAVTALMPDNSFSKRLRKCFIIAFDNLGFSIFMLVYDFILLLFSIFCMGMLPSFSGIVLAKTNALRLRLYKYDWLEAHPELKTKRGRKAIPWEELLQNDKDILGPRGFKSFIFPWK